MISLGILRTITQLAALSEIPPEKAIAMATGNTAKVFELNTGLIEVGKLADLVIMDAPLGSAGKDVLGAISIGDIPGIAMVIAKGEIVVQKSRNAPPCKTNLSVS